MNIFDEKNKKSVVEKNQLELKDYRKLKPKIVELSYYLNMEAKANLPKKKMNREIKKLCEEFKVDEKLEAVFISNLFLPNERDILKKIEEAKSFGCKVEDAPLYISLNHQIPKELIELKLAEFEVYKDYYQKQDQEEIEKVFHKIA